MDEYAFPRAKLVLIAATDADAKRFFGRVLLGMLGSVLFGMWMGREVVQNCFPPLQPIPATLVCVRDLLPLPIARLRDDTAGLQFVMDHFPGLCKKWPIYFEGSEPIGIPVIFRF